MPLTLGLLSRKFSLPTNPGSPAGLQALLLFFSASSEPWVGTDEAQEGKTQQEESLRSGLIPPSLRPFLLLNLCLPLLGWREPVLMALGRPRERGMEDGMICSPEENPGFLVLVPVLGWGWRR